MSRRAAIYVRVSLDPTGQRLGVTRQLTACETKAQDNGWTIAGVYEDNDVSAFTGRHRPAYERMLTDLEAGIIDAVIVWDLDRLTRRPIEIETFIDLADRKHIALASVGGDTDLATDNGRLYARIKGAVARAEIERRSERQRAANAQRAETGKPHVGRRRYGYTRDYRIDPVEAAHLRAAADVILAGGTLAAAALLLEQRGARTALGNTWHRSELRRVLVNPAYAGHRVYRGTIVGPGDWEPIWDEDTHTTLSAVFNDPSRRRTGAPNRYLLSGLAVCGTCGGTIYGARSLRSGKGNEGRAYFCESRKHVARDTTPVDRWVGQNIVDRLSREDAVELVTPDNSTQARELREEERRLRARLDGLAEAYAAGDIDDLQLRAGTKRVRTQLDDVTSLVVGLVRRPALVELVTADDTAAAWEAMTIDWQRSAVEALVDVKVHSPGRGARVFRSETVDVTFRETR